MSNGTSLTTTKFDPQQLAVLDEVASQCDIALREAGNNISGALAVAENMQRLRQLITPQMLTSLAALQGTALGFRTDRRNAKSGPKEYSPEELRDPFIEATVRGFRAIGNEFNIIAGNFYGAKSGFERKVRTFPGLSDFQAFYDVEETSGGFARVQCVATWMLDGEPGQFCRRKESINGKPFDNRVRVRVNEGMGYDALIGKAQRKFYAAVYDYLINADTATPEGDPDDAIVDPEAGKKVRRSQLFDERTVQESSSPNESDQAPLVLAYRQRLAAIAAKADVSGIAREAGKDAGLTAAGRAEVMKFCSDAMKAWPNHIAVGESSTSAAAGDAGDSDTADLPFNPPGDSERAAVEANELLTEWSEALGHTDSLIECDRMEREEIPRVPEALKPRVLELILARKAAIRGGRGERSGNGNVGQPSTDPLEWTRSQAEKATLFQDWKRLDSQIGAAKWSDATKAEARQIVADAKAEKKGAK